MVRVGFTIRLLLAVGLLFAALSPAWAERPSGPALLPAETMAMVRVASYPEMRERFKQTSTGRVLQDPEIAPLATNLWASLAKWWEDIEEQVGVPLDELRMLPQGEICFGVVPQEGNDVALVLLLDAKDQMRTALKMIETGEASFAERGGTKSTEVIGDVKCNVYTGPGGRVRLTYFEKEGTLVFASKLEASKQIIEDWTGTAAEPRKHLSDNERFAAIMNRCRGTKDEPPQMSWYVDPIALVKQLSRGNTAAQTSLALIPVLGLDGLQGVGGSLILATEDFNQISHIHVLLSNPRAGVLELATMTNGDTSPESWVPADAASYVTVHWDLNQMYHRGANLYNSLTEEGAFQKEVKERVEGAINLDFETEFLPSFGGRVSMFTWIQKPYRLNSQSMAVGVKLSDAKAFMPLLEKIVARNPERTEKVAFGTVSYFRVKAPDRERPANAPPRELLRDPTPCFGIVGDYLLLADSEENFHHAISAQSDKDNQLANQLDYKLIASKIKRQNGGETAGLVTFNRPEEGLRMLYEVARGEAAKGQIDRLAGEGNRGFEILKKGFEDHPLPPFSTLEKYFAPGGGVMTNEETGFHFMGFELKRD